MIGFNLIIGNFLYEKGQPGVWFLSLMLGMSVDNNSDDWWLYFMEFKTFFKVLFELRPEVGAYASIRLL